ncbi:lytic transglycosylase F [Chitinophagaceae bacterium LB-8]|uniref:Lytic transglycosylase F n=1 Tax=Paraflavisolibacter caeni TaxID=2982496 RepID=A0A9X2XT26_9BACT|nr:lytic transglycosylase F [Paraflavisolibacter caeni]MCU7547887.1 lytic transglycosylase F [Paraflavisolibacter caeni]
MKRFIHFCIFLMVIVCHFACENATVRSVRLDPEITDTAESYAINIKGDSISYFHWAAEDEILGLPKTAFGDLDSIIARGYIRVLVPYSKTYYYVEGMKRYGLAYDLLNLFEKELNRQLNFNPPRVHVIFMPVSREHILQLLNDGYADMIASGYTITPEREKLIDFSLPTVTGVKDIVVGGPSAPPIQSITDLAGQHIYIRENSSYQASLIRLNDSLRRIGLKPVHIEFIGHYLEAEDMLEMVNGGLIPYTIIAEDLATLWNSVYKDLKVYTNIAVKTNVSYGWAFRKNSPKLKAAVNKFIPTIRKGTTTGNMLYDKYLKNKERLRNAQSPEALAALNNFRTLFQKYGNAYSLDWLLLSAQAFQESQLKQETVSHAGAVGLMQLLPSTAANPPINIPNIKNAENNVHAGVKYMRYLIDNYFSTEQMDTLNVHLFALAAYNAGPGNVRKLRREAMEKGLNANEWFNNVEILAAQHIGVEPVQYVSNIYKYYRAYMVLKHYKVLRDQHKIAKK